MCWESCFLKRSNPSCSKEGENAKLVIVLTSTFWKTSPAPFLFPCAHGLHCSVLCSIEMFSSVFTLHPGKGKWEHKGETLATSHHFFVLILRPLSSGSVRTRSSLGGEIIGLVQFEAEEYIIRRLHHDVATMLYTLTVLQFLIRRFPHCIISSLLTSVLVLSHLWLLGHLLDGTVSTRSTWSTILGIDPVDVLFHISRHVPHQGGFRTTDAIWISNDVLAGGNSIVNPSIFNWRLHAPEASASIRVILTLLCTTAFNNFQLFFECFPIVQLVESSYSFTQIFRFEIVF